jgi:hypothetical protein
MMAGMGQHRVVVEADQPTGIEVTAAEPGDRCSGHECTRPARFRIIVTRPDATGPIIDACCRACATGSAEGLLRMLAARKAEAQRLN